MRKIISLITILLLLIPLNTYASDPSDQQEHEILVLNSYHEGYKWSDDIVEGIKIQFAKELLKTNITVEYMDTKNNFTTDYDEALTNFLIRKYTGKEYDVIIASDDAAYNFMKEHGAEVFPGIPYVFCGVNYYDETSVQDNYTGIVESYDIEGTLAVAKKANPDLEKVYIINDQTTTGVAIQKAVDQVIEKMDDEYEFILLNNESTESIKETISNLGQDSIVFFCVYFRDIDNNLFNFDQSVRFFSNYASVPMYGMWEFLIGNGITGGNLISGFYQGEKAAEYAIEIIQGTNPANLEIITKLEENHQYDFEFLVKNEIPISVLPPSSKIINRDYNEKQTILVLHSYHGQMEWVKGIEEGIESALDNEEYDLYFDYMDTKRVANPSYLKQVYDQMIIKHKTNKYDIVMVSDNNAFNFIVKFGNSIFGDIPIVFCGLNNIDSYENLISDNITGVAEAIDIRGTIEIALEQNPQTKNIYIINDYTSTGVANQKEVEKLESEFPNLVFNYYREVSMDSIQESVSKLSDNSIVLLLSFTTDNDNSVFSYKEAGTLIASSSSRPVYVVWDFYLGTGVIGGKVTSGFDQGQAAGKMADQILNGLSPSEIPIQYESPNRYIFDYQVLERYNLTEAFIPEGTDFINREIPLLERYFWFIFIIGLLFVVLVIVYIDSKVKVLKSNSKADLMERHASYDQLTHIYSRRKGMALAEQLLADKENHPITICFVDLDNLKRINDKHGHDKGDEYITTSVQLIEKHIRDVDVFFRFGGDEFVVVFKNSRIKDVKRVMRRIYRYLAEANEERRVPISFSHGLSEYKEGMTLTETIKEADTKMYQDKQKKKQS